MKYAADFETTTNPDDCRVWAWGCCEIENPEHFHKGKTIDSFIAFLEKSRSSSFYFHNEKFDGTFIISWLLNNGFEHREDRKDKATRTFNTLISDMGLFYAIEIVFEKRGKNYNKVILYDSLKIIPFSVEEVAKAFDLPVSKGKIDYKKEREIGYNPTDEEWEYIFLDVNIMARALKIMFDQGLDKMTTGANALEDYKNTIGKRNFERWFPSPDYMLDQEFRQCYKGGFTYCSPKYAGKDIGCGLVIDVNSLYPWAMSECLLPFGNPIFFEGEYIHDDIYPLYIQMFACSKFQLKEGKIPTVQIKHGDYNFPKNLYLESSGDQYNEIIMCMTSVDLALFLEHYDVEDFEPISGWKFRGSTELFKPYVQKWTAVKTQATIDGNAGMRTISKLMQNSLYGKFAKRMEIISKYPYLKDGVVKYRTSDVEIKNALYIPVAAFITAWARDKTIRSAQQVYKYFVYADTDSLHLHIPIPEAMFKLTAKQLSKLTTKDIIAYGVDIPDNFDIDPVRLGAWKLESIFRRGRFLRQKSYIEDSNEPETWTQPKYSSKLLKEFCEETGIDFETENAKYSWMYDVDKFKITCAGMSKGCYPYVNWDNFRILSSFKGKLKPTNVKGGIVLEDTIFTIRPC